MEPNKQNNTRILDKSTYSNKTLETYEMVAAYYVDMFYNHLYFEARKLRNDKTVKTITEGYKHTLTAFLQAVEDPALYKKSLLGMHTFFTDNGFTSITFSNCINRIIHEFIPEDYAESIKDTHKNSILRTVLSNVNKSFIHKIVRSYLGMIIDNHEEKENTRILQDEFVDLLLLERESMYNRFITGRTGGNKKSGVNIALVESMQEEIKTLCSEKYELKKTIANCKKIIVLKDKMVSDNLEKITQLTNLVNELKNELHERQTHNHVEESAVMESGMTNAVGTDIGNNEEQAGADTVFENIMSTDLWE